MSRKGYAGTSTGWLDFLGAVTSYVPFRASGVHAMQFCLTSPATFYEYRFMADLHIPNLHPFILGAWASWGVGFSVSVAQSRHLLPLALWSRRSCLAHGYYSVSRGCGVLSASEICLPPPPPAFIPSSSCVVSTKRNFYLTENLSSLSFSMTWLFFIRRRCVEFEPKKCSIGSSKT